MTFNPLILEVFFGFAILGFAIWQIISLSPKRIAAEEAKKQAEAEKAALEKSTSNESSGHPEG
jgi:hypothetical protein